MMVIALRSPETLNSKPSEDHLLLEVTSRGAGWVFFFSSGSYDTNKWKAVSCEVAR